MDITDRIVYFIVGALLTVAQALCMEAFADENTVLVYKRATAQLVYNMCSERLDRVIKDQENTVTFDESRELLDLCVEVTLQQIIVPNSTLGGSECYPSY
jgi:hypothetical protein